MDRSTLQWDFSNAALKTREGGGPVTSRSWLSNSRSEPYFGQFEPSNFREQAQ